MIPKLYSPSNLMSYFINPFEVLMKKAIKQNKDLQIKQDADDPLLKLIAEKGIEHEAKLFKELKSEYKNTVAIKNEKPEAMLSATKTAMESGADLIYQAALSNDQFFGIPDFLIKTDGSSMRN
jgi:predicted RecB family nuclease